MRRFHIHLSPANWPEVSRVTIFDLEQVKHIAVDKPVSANPEQVIVLVERMAQLYATLGNDRCELVIDRTGPSETIYDHVIRNIHLFPNMNIRLYQDQPLAKALEHALSYNLNPAMRPGGPF